MKRKLIITESQYNKLQEFLFETADINHTLDFVKVGDILRFKSSTNNPYDIKIAHVDHASNEILGYLGNEKVRFNFNAYDEQTKKFNFQILDEKTKKYVDKQDDISRELDIIRNGKILPISDAGNRQNPQNPTAKPDDISKPVELDPNISTPTSGNTLKAAGEEARKKIDYSKDPLLKKAFHRQAGFWDQFRAELAGKKSEPDGIRSVLNILGKYTNKKVKDKFGDTFTEGKQVNFEIISRTQLGTLNGKYTFYVRNWTEGDEDTLTLSEYGNKPDGLRLIVKDRKKNENDVYLCTLKRLINNIEEEEEVEVRFSKSAGYNPTITSNEPIKPIK